MIGEALGGYRITRKIGEGGMGVVYEAEHLFLGRRAAIKCLLPELSSNAEACGRFFIEAKAAAMINHPSLVDIYDQGHTEGGNAYIIMEFLDGEDLGMALKREKKLKLPMSLSIARQVASALGAVHQKGIVHRDLKPDNLFLVKTPGNPSAFRVKVLDFGIAKLTGPENKELSVKTRTGSVLGTPSYMSPEQCRGHGKVDYRSDVYSLGCIMYEMLTGRPPFQGSGYGEVLAQHIYEPPPPLRTIDPTMPESLEQLLARSLVKEPDKRLQSMDELGTQIDQLFQAIAGMPAPSIYDSGQLSGPQFLPAPPPPPPPQQQRQLTTTPMPIAPPPVAAPAPPPAGSEPPRHTTLRGTASEVVQKPGGKKKVVPIAIAGGAAALIAVIAIAASGSGGKASGSPTPAVPALTPVAETKKPDPAPAPAPAPALAADPSKPAPVADTKIPEPEPAKPIPVAVTATPVADVKKPEPTPAVADVKKPEPAPPPVAEVKKPAPPPVAEVKKPEPPAPTPPPLPQRPVAVVAAPPPAPPARVHVKIYSVPPGAEVWSAAGARIGKTPYEQELAPGPSKVAYVLKLKGYKDGRAELPGEKGGTTNVKLVEEPKVVAEPPPSPAKPAPSPKHPKSIKDGVVNPFAK